MVETVSVSAWVAEAAARGRVPVGEVVSWCRWPVGLGKVVAGGEDTLVSIAAAAFPVRCLACRTPHRITDLTAEVDPKELDQVRCPACGTVGLWPPTRPLREIQWANEELWSTYGPALPLLAGQVVAVPQLCGQEVLQRIDRATQPTFDEQLHTQVVEKSGKRVETEVKHTNKHAGRERDRLVRDWAAGGRSSAPEGLAAEVVARSSAARETGRPALTVVPGVTGGPVHAGGSGQGDVGVVDEAGGTKEPVEVGQGVQQDSSAGSGVAAEDLVAALRSELGAAVRLLADATTRVGVVVDQFDELTSAFEAERGGLVERVEAAEVKAAEGIAELDRVRREAEAERDRLAGESAAVVETAREDVATAVKAQLRAEGRAETLADELKQLRNGEWRKAVVAVADRVGRRGAGRIKGRLTDAQQDMLYRIGDGPAIGWREDAGAADGGVWLVDGLAAATDQRRTLQSLLRRGLIGYDAAAAVDGVAVVVLADGAIELYQDRRDRPAWMPGEAASASTTGVVVDAGGPGPGEVVDDVADEAGAHDGVARKTVPDAGVELEVDAATLDAEQALTESEESVAPVAGLAEVEAQLGEPSSDNVRSWLRRVEQEQVRRNGHRVWQVTNATPPVREDAAFYPPPVPAMAVLDWMLKKGMIRIGAGGRVTAVTRF